MYEKDPRFKEPKELDGGKGDESESCCEGRPGEFRGSSEIAERKTRSGSSRMRQRQL